MDINGAMDGIYVAITICMNDEIKYIRIVRDSNGEILMISDETTQELTNE